MSNPSNRRDELRRQQQAAAARQRTNRIIGIGAAVVALVLVAVFIAVLVQNQSNQAAAATVTPPNASAAKNSIVLNPGRAAADAPRVTVYLDYQCPNCKVFEETYGPMLQQEAEAGTWTLENKTLMFMDKNLGNTASTRATIAAACSDVAGRYVPYSAAVYANQAVQEVRGAEGFSQALLRDQLPAQVGITGDQLTQFQQCVDKNATKAFVGAVEKSAYEDGVTGTPTIAVNGKVVDLRQLTSGEPAALKALLLAGK